VIGPESRPRVSLGPAELIRWVGRDAEGVCDGEVSGDEDREPAGAGRRVSKPTISEYRIK